jgi:Ice-binding-like
MTAKMSTSLLSSVAIVGLVALLGAAAPSSAQTPPSTGSATSFAVLGGSSVTAAGTGTVVNGDVGVSPGTSLTGFPAAATVTPPFSTHNNDGPAIAAQSATTALYIDLSTRTGATPIGPEVGSTLLPPGLYSFSSTANIANNTTLTLSGAGVYIFQVGSALTANTGSNVVLQGGADPCNVFWQVTSAATLLGVNFSGTVVAQAGVTVGTGATLLGRALTTPAGAVTLNGGDTVGGCSAAGGPIPPVPTLPQLFLVLLAAGLAGLGYLRLRRRSWSV